MLKRTHACGEITEEHIGQEVTLNGWVDTRRDLGGVVFIELRDRSGLMQIVFNPEANKELHELSSKLRNEFVIGVKGIVAFRPEDNINKNLKTGIFEIHPTDMEIMNVSKTPPFEIKDDLNVDETVRLKYRYLDLRRHRMQEIIQLKHNVSKFMRDYLDERGFYEIETPILTKSTPEGARDYLVPSRVNPGTFFALPQSPQIFKQILMVAGLEKYFQIARCFRDEDLRADRQPEFTQLDVEMSFVEREDILDLMEGLMVGLIKKIKGIDIPRPIRRLTFDESMNMYGSDKPDTRFGMELIELTDVMAESSFSAFADIAKRKGKVKALKLDKMASSMTRNQLDMLRKQAVKFGAKDLTWFIFNEDGTVKSPIAKFFKEEEIERIKSVAKAENGDILLIAGDSLKVVANVLGRLRLEFGKKLNLIDESKYELLWIVDFPLFEWNENEKRWDPQHHPFVMPQLDKLHYLETDTPEKCVADMYDLVLNGFELGSGSIRIHKKEIQQKMFELINIDEEVIKQKFGFMLNAFEYGAPPHGGIGLGLDRILMIFAGTDNLRDVIAFPKTNTASCLMSDAPNTVDDAQLKELHLRVTHNPNKEESGKSQN